MVGGRPPARGHGGIGRRTRLKIACPEEDVGVQVPLPPSQNLQTVRLISSA